MESNRDSQEGSEDQEELEGVVLVGRGALDTQIVIRQEATLSVLGSVGFNGMSHFGMGDPQDPIPGQSNSSVSNDSHGSQKRAYQMSFVLD